MRHVLILLIIAIAAGICCTPFPTRFERIENNRLRALNAVFLPRAEAAPGDTLTVRLYFGGDSVSGIDNWQICTDVITNEYGSEATVNWQDLDTVGITDQLPDSISKQIIIPDSIFYTTQAISEQMLGLVKNLLPAGMQSFSRNELVDFVMDLSRTDFNNPAGLGSFITRWAVPLGITGVPDSSTPASLTITAATLLNVFSIKGYLMFTARAVDGQTLPIRCQFVIRFNSALANSPFSAYVPVNHNPKIRTLALVTVDKDSVYTINLKDPQWEGRYTAQFLYNEAHPDSVSDTVAIDVGHSYFFAVDTSITDIILSGSGTLVSPLPVEDTSTLVINLPEGKVNIPVLPGDTIRDPFIAPRTLNPIFHRTMHMMPFTVMQGETLFIGRGTEVAVDTGINAAPALVNRNSISMQIISRDFGLTFEQTVAMENYSFQWWFQNTDADRASLPEDSLLLLLMANGEMVSFLPPIDTAMHRFRLWVSATDNFLGEINRPVGKTTRSTEGYFTYSQAYINKHK
jgi:hypothetical protein